MFIFTYLIQATIIYLITYPDPLENFIVKHDYRNAPGRQSKLLNAEALSSRATEGSGVVLVEYMQYFIQHSIDVFPQMLEKRPFVIASIFALKCGVGKYPGNFDLKKVSGVFKYPLS